MENFRKRILATAGFLKERIKTIPKVGILIGTGLGDCVSSLESNESFQYEDIPGFPVSTVQGHSGRLASGYMSKTGVVAFQGRFHLYEGYSPAEVTYPVRVMQELEIKKIILLNAAGGLNPAFKPGDIMLIADHINLTGANPLVGPNESAWGIRFPDMIHAYDKNLATAAETAAKKSGLLLKKGVYAGLKGPSLETPAEVRFLKTIGADAVGFSTVLEVIAAVHGGLKALGLSIITNINDPENPVPATVEDVIKVAAAAAPKIESIIKNMF